jgi:hypothetical protein
MVGDPSRSLDDRDGISLERARHHLTTAVALYRDMGTQRWGDPTSARLNKLDFE